MLSTLNLWGLHFPKCFPVQSSYYKRFTVGLHKDQEITLNLHKVNWWRKLIPNQVDNMHKCREPCQ